MTVQAQKGDQVPGGVTLLIPVLDEMDGLREIIPRIDPSLFTETLIVDGGSRDGSIEFARDNSIRVLHQTRNGLGFGVFDALKEIRTEFVIEFSPDGNCPVEFLPLVVAKLKEGYDLVVVSRYLDGAKSYDDDFVTALGNFVFTRMIRVLGKYPITDALTIYRGYRKSLAGTPAFERYLVGPVFEPLVSAMATMSGSRIAEIPGDEPRRIGGKRKMRVFYNGSCILLMIMRLYLSRIGLKRGTGR